MPFRRETNYRHIFKLWDGEVIMVPQRDAIRVKDRRGEWEPPQTVWEVTMPNGIVRRLWPEDIKSWEAEIR